MDKGEMAAELRAEIVQIAFEVNGELTQILRLIESLKGLGERVLALRSHNMDVAKAGGILLNVVPQDLEQVIKQLLLAHKSLEDYQNIP